MFQTRLRARLLTASLWLGLASAPTLGQDVAPDILKAQLGEWLVVPEGGGPGCRVVLESRRIGGGMAARPGSDCGAKLPLLADTTSWVMAGGVTLRNAAGKAILEFGEDETTLLKTAADSPPQYFMVQAKPGVDRAPSKAAVVGRWELRRPGGGAICKLRFSDKPRGSDSTDDGLEVEPGCDPAVARLKLSSWRVEDFTLMLYGAKDSSLAFEPAQNGFDKAAREGGKPLSLVKAP